MQSLRARFPVVFRKQAAKPRRILRQERVHRQASSAGGYNISDSDTSPWHLDRYWRGEAAHPTPVRSVISIKPQALTLSQLVELVIIDAYWTHVSINARFPLPRRYSACQTIAFATRQHPVFSVGGLQLPERPAIEVRNKQRGVRKKNKWNTQLTNKENKKFQRSGMH